MDESKIGTNLFFQEASELSRKEENKKILETLSEKFGLIYAPEKISVYYSEGKLTFSLWTPEFRFITMWADTMNKLTAMALNFAINHGKDPETCLFVKDFLIGSFNIADVPPSERIFKTFVDWGLTVDLRSLDFSIEPEKNVLKISGNKLSYDVFQRYLPCNFTVEELSGFLLTTGDLPKDKDFATKLFHERKQSIKKNGRTKRKFDWRDRD